MGLWVLGGDGVVIEFWSETSDGGAFLGFSIVRTWVGMTG